MSRWRRATTFCAAGLVALTAFVVTGRAAVPPTGPCDMPPGARCAPSAGAPKPRSLAGPTEPSPMDAAMRTNKTLCEVQIEASGLPHRSEVLIERERGAVAVAAHTLAGSSTRGAELSIPPFTIADLVQALESDSVTMRQAGALLVGRCGVAEGETAKQLDRFLEERLRGEVEPIVKVELAMSRVLRGDADGSARAVLSELAKGAPGHAFACVAAGYLAQHGLAEGWPTVLGAFAVERPQGTRVAALKAAVAFAPLQGTRVGDAQVDPQGLLAKAVADEEISVRQSAIQALVDARHPEAVSLIETVSSSDPSPGVRAVADHWLWHLRKARTAPGVDKP